jgi:hypothetical protein
LVLAAAQVIAVMVEMATIQFSQLLLQLAVAVVHAD